MRIVRHIFLNAREHERRELARLGVELPHTKGMPSNLEVFDLAEDDPRWPAVRDWLISRGEHPGWERTEFTEREVAEARWLNLVPQWHQGYPQPEDDFRYRQITYDGRACSECGVGARQRAPFQMTGEPRWGRRSILQLNWVFDEYFTTPEMAAEVFEPLGVQSRRVTNRRGIELKTVVQLMSTEFVSIQASHLPRSTCPRCGEEKLEPLRRGPLPELVAQPSGPIARTREWFGSGFSAHNEIVVSQRVAQTIRHQNLRGVDFRPVADGPWVDPGLGQPSLPIDPVRLHRFLDATRTDPA